MGSGILLYRAALFIVGLIVAWLLYRLLVRLGSHILPHRPRILRTAIAASVLLLPPGLALDAWRRLADIPLIDIRQTAPDRFSLGILNEHPTLRDKSALLLRLLHDHPERISHLDIATAGPSTLSVTELPRKFWRFRYRNDPQLCLDRESYRTLPLFGGSPPPLPFKTVSRNATGCLSVREYRDPEEFSPYLYAPTPGWRMKVLEALSPLLLVEKGAMPLLMLRRPNAPGARSLLEVRILRIHWGFWSPEPIFTFERSADPRRSLEEWIASHSSGTSVTGP